MISDLLFGLLLENFRNFLSVVLFTHLDTQPGKSPLSVLGFFSHYVFGNKKKKPSLFPLLPCSRNPISWITVNLFYLFLFLAVFAYVLLIVILLSILVYFPTF